jgi:hypothetical protein
VDNISGRNLITFSRASSATFVGSDGILKTAATNEPRFDHNPTTGESLGLLVEEARTNLLLQSNGFATTWAKINSSVTAAAGTAPDGTVTAWEVKDTSDSVTTQHSVSQNANLTAGITYSASVFIKAGTLPRVVLLLSGGVSFSGGNRAAGFNLATGVVYLVSGTGATAQITPYPNGWYRCTLTATADGTGTGSTTIRADNGTTTNYIGDGTGTILIWGAQLEAGAFPTSYIPTTTAAATRAADVASITGSAFSSWYRQDEGTVFAEGRSALAGNTGANRFPLSINDGTTNEEVGLYWNTAFNAIVNDNGISQGNSFGGAVTANARAIHAFGYRLNDLRGYGNGTAAIAITSATMATPNRMNIGRRDDASFWFNGTISRITFWPARLPNTTLQRLTQ